MHILRWLFTHPIIFVWVLAILAILLGYGIGGSPKEATHQAAADGHATEQQVQTAHAGMAAGEAEQQQATDAAAPEAAPVVEETVVETVVVETDQATAVVTETVQEVATTAAAETSEQVAEATGEVVEQAQDAAAGAAEQTADAANAALDNVQEAAAEMAGQAADAGSEAVDTVAAATGAAVAAVTGGSEQAAADSSATAENAQAAADSQSSSPEDLLLAAREAYWSNDYERAAGFYQELLQVEDKPSHKGELANVYWKQGQSQAAVDLYVEIASWLKEQGRLSELQNIKVYTDLVDPAKGQAIGELLK
ncbi:MAG: hypothetical protein R3E95_01755 [Thiolinea sp.]